MRCSRHCSLRADGAAPATSGGSADRARRRRCRFRGRSATASGCSARSAISCCMPRAARGRSVLASEQALELQSDGRGWARNTVNRLCIDLAGRVSEPCTRDNVKESYLTPTEHPVTRPADRRRFRSAPPAPGRSTTATGRRQSDLRLRRAGQFPRALRPHHGRHRRRLRRLRAPQRVTTEIAVRDIFIAGLGDSIASGEGNPDRPIALADEGFCFRSYLGTAAAQYYRPSRAGYKGGRACEAPDTLAGLAAPERAVVQLRLPPLALQLPDPHRAGARRAISAHRGDLSAAGLHRRHHRRRPVRLAARPRMPADEIGRHLLRHRQRASSPNCAKPSPPPSAASPTASSIWCCCRSAPTTSIFPAWSPT